MEVEGGQKLHPETDAHVKGNYKRQGLVWFRKGRLGRGEASADARAASVPHTTDDALLGVGQHGASRAEVFLFSKEICIRECDSDVVQFRG